MLLANSWLAQSSGCPGRRASDCTAIASPRCNCSYSGRLTTTKLFQIWQRRVHFNPRVVRSFPSPRPSPAPARPGPAPASSHVRVVRGDASAPSGKSTGRRFPSERHNVCEHRRWIGLRRIFAELAFRWRLKLLQLIKCQLLRGNLRNQLLSKDSSTFREVEVVCFRGCDSKQNVTAANTMWHDQLAKVHACCVRTILFHRYLLRLSYFINIKRITHIVSSHSGYI